jgi:6-phosphofructokinase 1
MKTKTNCIGILTSGGDCPGLNAAIRGVVKAAVHMYGMQVIGILDGFRGLVENRTIPLTYPEVSGILTLGGTILGTSRDKPRKMAMGGSEMDMTATAVRNAHRLGIECLVCLGGGGTQKNALHLHEAGGLNVITLPKTIDNDVAETDISFGFDTALTIATEAVDRLHTTASSHQRIMVCEIMGHNAGWLALGSGIAGGADVILIPEITYDLEIVSEALKERRRAGKRFSILAVAEGAVSKETLKRRDEKRERDKDKTDEERAKERDEKKSKDEKRPKDGTRLILPEFTEPTASRLARELQHLTGIEARMTSLGHVQRGGTPSPTDRLLCTRLGAKAAELLAAGEYNVMVAVKGTDCVPVDLKKVAGKKKTVPLDDPWIKTARQVNISFGDQ